MLYLLTAIAQILQTNWSRTWLRPHACEQVFSTAKLSKSKYGARWNRTSDLFQESHTHHAYDHEQVHNESPASWKLALWKRSATELAPLYDADDNADALYNLTVTNEVLPITCALFQNV